MPLDERSEDHYFITQGVHECLHQEFKTTNINLILVLEDIRIHLLGTMNHSLRLSLLCCHFPWFWKLLALLVHFNLKVDLDRLFLTLETATVKTNWVLISWGRSSRKLRNKGVSRMDPMKQTSDKVSEGCWEMCWSQFKRLTHHRM